MKRTSLPWTALTLVLLVQIGCTSTVRPWRLIVNDDGEIPVPGGTRTVEQTLNDRFTATRGTQVDAYFLCIASTDRVVDPKLARPQDAMSQWAKYGDVPEHVDQMIRLYIEQAHEEGTDIFLAARLNDIHDAWAAKRTYPLKVQRPDLLLGKTRSGFGDALMNGHWSGLNWAEPVVRQHFLDFFRWACKKWDFDGVELDWFRHPLFFRLGEEQENIENMNQFVRDVRTSLNGIASKRGRRYLLTTRVPDSPKLALRTGFDVEQWLKEGLLDMLIVGGGYMPYGGRVKQFIDMAHRYGVHAYPCQNHYVDPEKMHSIAAGFWALEADGFYMFNYGGVDRTTEKGQCLEQLGSPETLAGLDKRFIADRGCKIKYVGHTNPPSQFPMPLVGGDPIELVVGDDLASVHAAGTDVRLTLRITVSNLSVDADVDKPSGSIVVRINGQQLPGVPEETIRRIDASTFAADVDASVMINGINQILVLPGPMSPGRLASTVDAIELVVDYPPHVGRS